VDVAVGKQKREEEEEEEEGRERERERGRVRTRRRAWKGAGGIFVNPVMVAVLRWQPSSNANLLLCKRQRKRR